MSDQLKPCPNPECTNSAPRRGCSNRSDWIECTTCQTRGPRASGGFPFAIRAWNALPRLTDAELLVEALEYYAGDGPWMIGAVDCGDRASDVLNTYRKQL